MNALGRTPGICLALLLTLAVGTASAGAEFDSSRNAVFLANANDYPGPRCSNGWKYSSCWSYIHHDGREYGVIGTCRGTLIYNLEHPTQPVLVGSFDGPFHTHRKMRSYREFIYVVCDGIGGPNDGVQIISMKDPDNPKFVKAYADSFNSSHTVTLDPIRGLLYCNGTEMDNVDTGMRILSLAIPENPVQVGWWPGGSIPVPRSHWVHETDPRKSIAYAACLYSGKMRILNVANPANPTVITEWTYPGAHWTHSSWTDKTDRYLYVCDETDGHPLRVFDLYQESLPPPIVYEYKPIPQPGNVGHVIHNPRVHGDEMFVPSYIDGVRFLDLKDPAHPAEYGWIDTFAGDSPRWWDSIWEACPYFPSGIVIASDMETGLWVFRPDRNYGTIRVNVKDQASGQPLAGAAVRVLTQGDLITTRQDGVARFGPSPGPHVIQVSLAGYVTQNHERVIERDKEEVLNVLLYPPGGGGSGGPGPKEFAQTIESARPSLEAVAASRRLDVRLPNPARGAARFVVDVPAAGMLDVEVVDLNGRRLFQLHHGAASAGELQLVWSGRDDAGHVVPPGVYFVRASAGEQQAKSQFTWLK